MKKDNLKEKIIEILNRHEENGDTFYRADQILELFEEEMTKYVLKRCWNKKMADKIYSIGFKDGQKKLTNGTGDIDFSKLNTSKENY